jgi:hypothetical protein
MPARNSIGWRIKRSNPKPCTSRYEAFGIAASCTVHLTDFCLIFCQSAESVRRKWQVETQAPGKVRQAQIVRHEDIRAQPYGRIHYPEIFSGDHCTSNEIVKYIRLWTAGVEFPATFVVKNIQVVQQLDLTLTQ